MERRNGPELATLLGLGAATGAIVLAGVGLGWLVDEIMGTFPACILAGLVLGIAGASVFIYTKFTKFLKE